MRGSLALQSGVLVLLIGLAASGPTSAFTSGVWTGGPDRDEAGRFLDCTMTAQSQAGILIAFVVSRDFDWGLALADQRWTLPVGEVHDIQLKVDSLAPMKAIAKMIDAHGMLVPLEKGDLAVEALRRAKLLTIDTPAGKFSFTLEGTGEAFDALAKCVRENLAEERASEAAEDPGDASP